MYITICETERQSRLDAWDRVLRAGAFTFKTFISLFLAGLDLRSCKGFLCLASSWGYSLVAEQGPLLLLFPLLGSTDSRTHGLRGCGTQASLLCRMWNLYGSGIKPVTPALAGRFLPLSHQGFPVLSLFSFNPSCVPTCPAPCLAHANDDCWVSD